MRRFAVILAVAVMLFSTAACEEKERVVELSESEAYAKYAGAVDTVVASGSFAGHISLYGHFSMMDLERENEVAIGIKHIFGSGDNFQAEIDATWTESNFMSYYRDGVYYLNSNDESFRYSMTGDQYLRMTLSMLVTETLFSEEDIFGLEVIEDSDGTAIRFEVSQSGMQDVLRQLAEFEDTGGVVLYGADDVSYEFEDAVVKVRIDKSGGLKNIMLSFIYLAEHSHIDEEAVVSGYLEIGMTVSQIGGVTIDYPDDLNDYPDISEEFA